MKDLPDKLNMDFRASTLLNISPGSPLLAHIPHSSAFIPGNLRDQFLLTDAELDEEKRLLTDWFTDELYSPVLDLGGSAVVFGLSRFVVDPERFEDDSLEIMSSRGMGVIYNKSTSRRDLRRSITEAEREMLLSFYHYHHSLVSQAAQSIIDRFGRCFFIDCHSYPENALPYELYPDKPRPDVCLGTEIFHTPPELAGLIGELAEEEGFSFGLNEPFTGSLVPTEYYGKDKRLVSFMLELKRSIYMDEKSTAKGPGFEKTSRFIRRVCERILETDL